MRLTYVTPYYAPAWAYGGPPRVTHDMARHLAARGHYVEVLTTDALDNHTRLTETEGVVEGVHVIRDRNFSNRWAWDYKIFLPVHFGRTLRQRIRQTDLIHLFSLRTFQNAVVLQALKKSRRPPPYVVSAFGELPRALGVKRPMKRVYDAIVGFELLRKAVYVLAQTPEEAQEYQRFGCSPEQIRQLPLAVDLEEARGVSPAGTFRKRWGLDSSHRVILFLGRIHEYKGLDVLLKAFAEVVKTRSDARLVIAGRDDGYLTTACDMAESLAPGGRVIFPGPIYGADRFAAYRDADIFAITPTHAEQTSLAALEACAVGTPVLLSQQAPIPDIDTIGGGVTVAAVPDCIASALGTFLDRSDRPEMGHRAAQLVAYRYSWETVTTTLESIYEEVVRAR